MVARGCEDDWAGATPQNCCVTVLLGGHELPEVAFVRIGLGIGGRTYLPEAFLYVR
jgi:hypothetical protein